MGNLLRLFIGAFLFGLCLGHVLLENETPTEAPTENPTFHQETTENPTTHEVTSEHPTTHEVTTEHPTTHEGTTVQPTTVRPPYHSTFVNKDCNFTACEAPNCTCLMDLPPKGLNPDQIPQFVLITFDGAVTITNFPYYQKLFHLTNPNGCPIHATYFVSHVDTNYKLVHELFRHGNEIGVHSISKSKNNYQDYWKNLDYEGWKAEFGGQRRILSKYADIPIEKITGARAPNLQTAGNVTFTALVNEDFHYDCSNPSRKGIKSPFFPYTLDYGFQRMSDCQVQPCLKEGQNYPGFWEVPMNDLNVEYKIKNEKYERECASASACILFDENGNFIQKPNEDQIFELFRYNFERFYNANKAPFPLFLSEDWMHEDSKRNGLMKFIEKISQNKDVYFISLEELLDWMKNSSDVNQYSQTKCKPIEQTKCAMQHPDSDDLSREFKKKCDFTNIGELNGLTKRMIICDDLECPSNYPWVDRN